MEFIKKIFVIWKYVMFKPKKFFDTVPKGPWYQTSLIFGIIMMWIGTIVGYVIKAVIGSPRLSITVGAIVLAPFFLYLFAAVQHFFIRIFKGAGNFDATFKIMAYSEAIAIFTSIPLIGFIGSIWGVVIIFTGIRKLHRLSAAKTIFSMIAPLVVFIFAAILITAAHQR